MTKYIFTKERKLVRGTKLYRIQAVRDFGTIIAGTIGGWVEHERNLDHGGPCWIADEAIVMGQAQVCHSATVMQYASISGNAGIMDRAHIYGCAEVGNASVVCEGARIGGYCKISGYSHVSGQVCMYGYSELCCNALVTIPFDYITIGPIGDERYITAFREVVGYRIKAGCFNGDSSQFHDAVVKKYGSSIRGREYLQALELIKIRFERTV